MTVKREKTSAPGVYRVGDKYVFWAELPRDPASGKRRQQTGGGFSTVKDARDARAEVLAAVRAQGGYRPPSKQTLQQWAQEWLATIDAQELAPSTQFSYRRNLELHVLPVLGHIPLRDLDGAALTKLYADLRKSGNKAPSKLGQQMSIRSVQYIAGTVAQMLTDARKSRRITYNPADDATVPKARSSQGGRHKFKVWTGAETARFLDAVADDRLSAAWVLLAHTGARRGEVLGLRWEDVDLDAGTITIAQTLGTTNHVVQLGLPKTEDSARVVELDARSVAALKAHRARQAQEHMLMGAGWSNVGDLVFTKVTGEPLHPERFSRQFQRMSARHGLPEIRLHDLRHGWATAALTKGVPLKVVSDRLGHKGTAITADIYTKVTREVSHTAAETVAEVFASPVLKIVPGLR